MPKTVLATSGPRTLDQLDRDEEGFLLDALYRLFPRGYGQQACKIAGMTKPRKLMLDV